MLRNGHAIILVLATLLGGCACSTKPKPPAPVTEPSALQRTDYRATSSRVLASFMQGPYVCARGAGGELACNGEAILWSGVYLWSAPCADGAAASAGLAAMVTREGGGVLRLEPIGEYANGRQATLDSMVGFMLGVTRRVLDCGEAELWREPLLLMTTWQHAHDERLHPGTWNRYEPEWNAVRDLLASSLGLVPPPSTDRLSALGNEVALWAQAIRLSYDAWASDATQRPPRGCYPFGLGLMTFLTLERLGQPAGDGHRGRLCAASSGAGNPALDAFCGRGTLLPWLDENAGDPDAWEFRFQRCTLWETPDGAGRMSAGVDRLFAQVMAFGWDRLQE